MTWSLHLQKTPNPGQFKTLVKLAQPCLPATFMPAQPLACLVLHMLLYQYLNKAIFYSPSENILLLMAIPVSRNFSFRCPDFSHITFWYGDFFIIDSFFMEKLGTNVLS